MTTKTYQVRIKEGCRHGRLHADYDARRPTGNPGPYALAGEVIEVTQAELDNFGDKFALLDPVSAALSAPNGTKPATPISEQAIEAIEQLRAELASVQAAHEKTATELAAARKAMSIAPSKPATRRGRPKKEA